MKGLFVEWAWRKWRIAGAAAGAVLLCSSAGAWPFNITMLFTGERTLGLHLFQFVREIHRPYGDSIRLVSDYLLEHAVQDDVVYVAGFADREALTFTTGHRVLFPGQTRRVHPAPPLISITQRGRTHVRAGARRSPRQEAAHLVRIHRRQIIQGVAQDVDRHDRHRLGAARRVGEDVVAAADLLSQVAPPAGG